jgi:hypothetical protein
MDSCHTHDPPLRPAAPDRQVACARVPAMGEEAVVDE